jgi:2-polyprenyl-3-methyl-5-hydroxy-6-metoxy-1,4-benzoquinol methylase
MQRFQYKSYQEYLDVQYQTNINRKFITHLKDDLRAEDIKHIQSAFSGKRVLCVGCREDVEVEDFIKAGFEAKGIDILPTAKQIQGDVNRLDRYFREGEFDIAYSCHILEHTYDPMKVLSMIRRICREGVYLVLPIRDHSDAEEPIFFSLMQTRSDEDLKELEEGLGKFELAEKWIRDDPYLPSGPEIAFAMKFL